jgi:DNA-binding transcriptional MocR family regulator
MEMLTAEDDPVLLEDFVYTGTLSILDPLRPKYVVANSDAQGMRPDRYGNTNYG